MSGAGSIGAVAIDVRRVRPLGEVDVRQFAPLERDEDRIGASRLGCPAHRDAGERKSDVCLQGLHGNLGFVIEEVGVGEHIATGTGLPHL